MLVRDRYLTLIYTKHSFLSRIVKYFMGAIALCPRPPLQIYAISQYLLLKKLLYEGAWA